MAATQYTNPCNGRVVRYANRPGFVYLMRIGGAFKVGRTDNLHRRRGHHANQYGGAELVHAIEVPDMLAAENAVIRMLNPTGEWRREREWFGPSEIDVDWFKALTPADLIPTV